MVVTPIRTRLFKENEKLVPFVNAYLPRVTENSIIVITSKIVALAEGRTAIKTTEADRERIIKQESEWALRTKWTWLTIKDHTVMSSAGIDESNANGKIILLPKDSFSSAERIRKVLMKKHQLKRLGVVITDSRILPLRAGIVGVALGYAGFKGIRDQRGRKDLFGRTLKMTRVDVADSIATAAVVCMGEADEQQPLALVTKAPVEFTNRIVRGELMMDFRDDMYAPLFENLKSFRIKAKKIKNPW